MFGIEWQIGLVPAGTQWLYLSNSMGISDWILVCMVAFKPDAIRLSRKWHNEARMRDGAVTHTSYYFIYHSYLHQYSLFKMYCRSMKWLGWYLYYIDIHRLFVGDVGDPGIIPLFGFQSRHLVNTILICSCVWGGQQICFGWRLQFMANPKKHIKAVAICINDVACLLLGSSTKIAWYIEETQHNLSHQPVHLQWESRLTNIFKGSINFGLHSQASLSHTTWFGPCAFWHAEARKPLFTAGSMETLSEACLTS